MITKLIFLGGGNMAEAIFAGLVDNQNFVIEVIQRNYEKANRLKNVYPTIKVSSSLDCTPNSDDIVLLAIKPQQAKEACLAIKEHLQHCTLISVMAGLPIESIASWIGNNKIIRTMPNTPSSIKKGITAIYSSDLVSEKNQKIAMSIFSKIGITYQAKNETEIDKIAPVSSSAIAFIYYFMEGMIESAVKDFGFSQDDATEFVKQAVIGSSALLEVNPEINISEQRAKVTSKKGMTEQGILTFENLGLHHIIATSMQNCYKRALEMAKEFN